MSRESGAIHTGDTVVYYEGLSGNFIVVDNARGQLDCRGFIDVAERVKDKTALLAFYSEVKDFFMSKRFKLFTRCRKQSLTEKAKLIGFATWIIMQCRRYSMLRLVDFRVWVIPAIDHQQIVFFFDDYDNPAGYVIWANLAPDAEHRLLNDSSFLLHESEWDEGSATWILDCCFPYGGLSNARQALRELFSQQGISSVNWVRRNVDYSVKQISNHVV